MAHVLYLTDEPVMITFGKSGELQIMDSDVFSVITNDMETPLKK